jgi:hypothetical protein
MVRCGARLVRRSRRWQECPSLVRNNATQARSILRRGPRWAADEQAFYSLSCALGSATLCLHRALHETTFRSSSPQASAATRCQQNLKSRLSDWVFLGAGPNPSNLCAAACPPTSLCPQHALSLADHCASRRVPCRSLYAI